MGQITEARELFEKIVAVRDDKHIRDLQASQGQNYLVHGLAWSAQALWCLGYPQQALNRTRTAIEFAQVFAHPFNRALALTYMAMLQEWCADPLAFRSNAEDAYAFASTNKATYYQAWSNILVCFARAHQQPDNKQVGELHEAIRAFIQTGARVRLPVYFSMLARACRLTKQINLGLEAIEQGLSESLQNGERWWDAELHRLRGALIQEQGAGTHEIEVAFQRAIEIAQSQQAKSLELRAVTSLAKLWQATGRSADAKQLLTPLYAWFSEGYDTPDLRTAQNLLAEL